MIAITILLVVLLGAINVFNFTSASREMNETLDEIVDSLQTAENAISSSEGPAGNFRNNFNTYENIFPDADLGDFNADGTAYFSVTLDTSGNALVIVMSGISSISEGEAVVMAQAAFDTKSVSGSDGDYKYMAYTSPASTGITYVFLDTDRYKNGVLRVIALSVLAGLACWGLMFILVFFLSKKFIKPIAENIDRQKVFVSDAGHEIKTPIAIIQANTEAMELYNGESKWSRNIKEQTSRLSGLVSNLLTLSKASETYEKPIICNVDMTAVVNENIEMFTEPAALQAKLISFDASQTYMVKGDKEQFSRIVSLLLDNAVKYAPKMSEINVSLFTSAKTVTLKITNECDELPDCPPERLFDRFYRPDASHNSQSGGTGIGLATVKAIADRYGASSSCIYGDHEISFLVSFKRA